jgi:hypothetical protein
MPCALQMIIVLNILSHGRYIQSQKMLSGSIQIKNQTMEPIFLSVDSLNPHSRNFHSMSMS